MLLSIAFARGQENIPYTELNYNVHYHWGLIDVSIAHGLVTIEKNGENFVGTLDGNSIPWNGRVFCVSDTLKAALTPNLERIDYVNGWYLKPKTNIYRSSQFDPNNPIFYKNIKGRENLTPAARQWRQSTLPPICFRCSIISACLTSRK